MKKSGIITIIVIVVIALGLGGWYLATRNKTNSTNTTSSNSNMGNMNMSNHSNSSSSSSSSSQSAQQTNAVTIQNFAFSPPSISVKEGTKVTWTNKDSVAHTVTETDSQSGPNSGDVSPNGSYSFVFEKAGTYHYHCSIHPEMVGTVTVTNP